MVEESYKMHEDDHKITKCGESEEEWKVVVKMNMSNERNVLYCVLESMKSKVCQLINEHEYCEQEECISNEFVPEIHFVAVLQLKAPVRTSSVESTLALNLLCFGAKVVYVRTPGTHPPQCKAIHDSLSVHKEIKEVIFNFSIHKLKECKLRHCVLRQEVLQTRHEINRCKTRPVCTFDHI
jgi:hypothetical protein